MEIAQDVTITVADPAGAEAAACLRRYYAELAERFDAGFDPGAGAAPDSAAMRAPLGCFLIARRGGLAIGCAALAGMGGWGEVKRLWVAPEARGLGLAGHLMAGVEAEARALGLPLLRLDTNRILTEAIADYRSRGWQEIAPYNSNPYAHHWFEKRL